MNHAYYNQLHTVTTIVKAQFNRLEINYFAVKFGLSEKHTKFEKNLPHALDVY